MVFIEEASLRRCAVCGKTIEPENVRIVEDLETMDGLVACAGEHQRLASSAMFLHQSELGYCSVYFTNGEEDEAIADADCLRAIRPVSVRFYRNRTGQVQKARLAAPGYLSYCTMRKMLRVKCEWTETENTDLRRLVSVENLLHYNPSLRVHFRFEPPADNAWLKRWEACRSLSSSSERKVFEF